MYVGVLTEHVFMYRFIRKSLRDFRTQLRNNQDTTAERSISVGRESLQVFFCTRGLGVLPSSTARG